MTVTLEPLEIVDIDDLQRWARDRDLNALTGAWPTPPDREQLLSLLTEWVAGVRIRAFTIRLDGQRIGNCWLGHLDTTPTLGISIGEGWARDQGYGTAAMRLLLDKAADLPVVTLWVYADNERAIHVYEQVGFRETGRGMRDGRESVEMARYRR